MPFHISIPLEAHAVNTDIHLQQNSKLLAINKKYVDSGHKKHFLQLITINDHLTPAETMMVYNIIAMLMEKHHAIPFALKDKPKFNENNTIAFAKLKSKEGQAALEALQNDLYHSIRFAFKAAMVPISKINNVSIPAIKPFFITLADRKSIKDFAASSNHASPEAPNESFTKQELSAIGEMTKALASNSYQALNHIGLFFNDYLAYVNQNESIVLKTQPNANEESHIVEPILLTQGLTPEETPANPSVTPLPNASPDYSLAIESFKTPKINTLFLLGTKSNPLQQPELIHKKVTQDNTDGQQQEQKQVKERPAQLQRPGNKYNQGLDVYNKANLGRIGKLGERRKPAAKKPKNANGVQEDNIATSPQVFSKSAIARDRIHAKDANPFSHDKAPLKLSEYQEPIAHVKITSGGFSSVESIPLSKYNAVLGEQADPALRAYEQFLDKSRAHSAPKNSDSPQPQQASALKEPPKPQNQGKGASQSGAPAKLATPAKPVSNQTPIPIVKFSIAKPQPEPKKPAIKKPKQPSLNDLLDSFDIVLEQSQSTRNKNG